jgi:hypothetical protein
VEGWLVRVLTEWCGEEVVERCGRMKEKRGVEWSSVEWSEVCEKVTYLMTIKLFTVNG